MEETNNILENNGVKKYSYEELEQIADRAIRENLKFRNAITELSENRGIQKLEFLFKVLDHSIEFSDDIVKQAVKEITEALFDFKKEETEGDKVNNE